LIITFLTLGQIYIYYSIHKQEDGPADEPKRGNIEDEEEKARVGYHEDPIPPIVCRWVHTVNVLGKQPKRYVS
jgi:hypothetical protein